MPRPRTIMRGLQGCLKTPVLPGAYQLVVHNGKPAIQAADAEGNRYAIATFRQLQKLAAANGENIPDCAINDWPEFKYRGLMLDCGRNYQSVESIKDVISMLAAYKFNVFHWHLSDNYGWRLESKKHPELQKREAFTRDIGKFYTQAEFKDILAFARKRGVTVIPELDMPGHTLAFRKATVYPRHFWFPKSAYVSSDNGLVTLETWIKSERDIECGAWIGMTGFSRSDGRSRDGPTPKSGQWNKHGATIELNGERIEPPKWAHPGVGGNPKETPLVDEDYWYRPPAKIRLKAGWNHVKMTLPKRGGWKWIGTFTPLFGTSDHPREVPRLEYSSR